MDCSYFVLFFSSDPDKSGMRRIRLFRSAVGVYLSGLVFLNWRPGFQNEKFERRFIPTFAVASVGSFLCIQLVSLGNIPYICGNKRGRL